MNKALWITRKNYLRSMISRISIHYGGDEIAWIEGHFTEVLEAYPGEQLENAIKCYENLVKQLDYMPKWRNNEKK